MWISVAVTLTFITQRTVNNFGTSYEKMACFLVLVTRARGLYRYVSILTLKSLMGKTNNGAKYKTETKSATALVECSISLQHSSLVQVRWFLYNTVALRLVCGVSVMILVTEHDGAWPQVRWADNRACRGCSTTIRRLVPLHPKISVVLCYALALSHQLSLLCMSLAG